MSDTETRSVECETCGGDRRALLPDQNRWEIPAGVCPDCKGTGLRATAAAACCIPGRNAICPTCGKPARLILAEPNQ